MPRYDHLRLLAYEIAPGASLPVTGMTARFPASWLRRIRSQAPTWDDRRLPTWALVELLDTLDPNIIHVAGRLDDEHWLISHARTDRQILRTAVAVWASTRVTPDRPDLDWFDLLDDEDLDWTQTELDLLAAQTHPNGTANPDPAVFRMLPGHLADVVAATGMQIRGEHRPFILGPVDKSGHRSAIWWPPERIDDPKLGPGLWAPKIDFHVETVPTHGRARIHAELSTVRFPLQPVRYVPSRGGRGPSLTLWLLADSGYLRAAEQPTLVSAGIGRRRVDGIYRWAWDPGLAHALAHLTHHAFPDPNDVVIAPAAHIDQPVSAYVLYSTGTKLSAPDDEDTDDKAARSVLHAAKTGFLPVDHYDLHTSMGEILEPLGIRPVADLEKTKTATTRLFRPVADAHASYTLELWTESPVTRQALLAAVTQDLAYTETASTTRTAGDGEIIECRSYTGPCELTVELREQHDIAAGIPRPVKGEKQGVQAARRIQHIGQMIGRSDDRRAAIVEIRKPAYFEAINKEDPYSTLKQAFPPLNRRLQCIHPINLYVPKPDAKRPKKTLPGTQFTLGDIHRASAAVQDALRSLGRVGVLPAPPGITGDFELIGIWLETRNGADIPIVVRIAGDGTATAQLATDDGTEQMPYADLPLALAAGRGRLSRSKTGNFRIRIADFLTAALGIDHATHDRAVFIRTSSFRTRGWDWLQDQHLTPDKLVLPGLNPSDDTVEHLPPAKCPGLRVFRIRERDSQEEVPRGLGTKEETYGRTSGVYPLNDHVYYAVNPRSDQMQTPLTVTKLDPGQSANALKQGSNNNPIEIVTAFVQPGDDRRAWAAYTQALRRAALHTDIASTLPLPLHLPSLADEYLR
ncbi:DUF3893 domain-containing protein [Actinomadura sp. LD22]|uniref:DUF3893 domain-containing protein n=1 Tax=Actinomadura physcomitrii TaxID=2650748 RepID=A0A6I4MVB0_9ACTN|nr:DUF3962 domain-containing protein [Actinomadura physcomitrii]MWA07251.1 DUF3893 domain-containing protein [Actinomadura physcomitrii]